MGTITEDSGLASYWGMSLHDLTRQLGGAVVFAVRTRLPFLRSRPSWAMLLVTGVVCTISLLLPYSPFARLFGFVPLPVSYLLAIGAIIAIYFISAELAKRWFYKF
jgi:P-type Mg2+ transporter